MTDLPIRLDRGAASRATFRCDLAEGRAAASALRGFLAEQGLDESELFACELCLAEACNNAVQYADEAGRGRPVTAEAICHASYVELRVIDGTPGFDWPGCVEPPEPARQRGRGLFIIQTLMDEVRYWRGSGENALVMRKTRTRHRHQGPMEAGQPLAPEELSRRLAECQHTVSNMARELCFRSESLSAVFRCCAELGRTSDLAGFSRRLLGDLLHLAAADWYVLRLAPASGERLETFAVSTPKLRGLPASLSTAGLETAGAEASAARARRRVRFDARRALAHGDPLHAVGPAATGFVEPLMFGESLVGTLAIGRFEPEPPFNGLQTEMVRTFAEFLAIQVVNTRHQEEHIRARLVARDLEIARQIQRALLPRTLPRFGGWSLAGWCESARQVGGDFYDAVAVDSNSLLLVVADVMGTGVPAAMFATITRSLVRALAAQGHPPGELLGRLNRLLHDELSAVGMFVTAQLVRIDLRERRLAIASAGHCPAWIVSADTGAVQRLCPNGLPLGVLPEAVYWQRTVALEESSGVFLNTDGLTDMRNAAGEMFGEKRLMNWLKNRWRDSSPAARLRDDLAAALSRFRAEVPLGDDQAFLILAAETSAAGSAAATQGGFAEEASPRSNLAAMRVGPPSREFVGSNVRQTHNDR